MTRRATRRMARTRVRWLASKDGLAHAQAGASPWTVCHQPAVREALAWPATDRCMDCARIVAYDAPEAVR